MTTFDNDRLYAAEHGYPEVSQTEHIEALAASEPPEDTDTLHEVLDTLTDDEHEVSMQLSQEQLTRCPGCNGQGDCEIAERDPVTGDMVRHYLGECTFCGGSGHLPLGDVVGTDGSVVTP